MKLQLATLLYFISNIVFISIRTIQILFFTESNTAFLKPSTMPINILFAAIGVLSIVAFVIPTFIKPQKIREVPERSYSCFVVAALAGALYLVSGFIALMTNPSGIFTAFISVLAAATSLLYGYTEFKGYEFPRVASIFLTAVWAWEFMLSYFFYTTRPMRFRTVLETFAIVFCVFFFLLFGKLKGGINKSRSARLLRPTGLVASTLCFTSLVPEFIVWIAGQPEKLTTSCVSQAALLAGGIFTAFISLYCFRPNLDDEEPDNNQPDDESETFKIVNINFDEQ